MRAMLSMMVAVGVLALSGCTNRALSLMDTDPLYGNTHPHLVWKDNQVQYQGEVD
ncbi:MAG TPA: hypothetical protein VLV76_03440 [Candidatus Acidoferrum sp.]|nr:hypothetical protein [Candidatus Acidoferrum sp.]